MSCVRLLWLIFLPVVRLMFRMFKYDAPVLSKNGLVGSVLLVLLVSYPLGTEDGRLLAFC